MKIKYVLLAVGLIPFLFSSCTKDYTCSCVETYIENGETESYTTVFTLYNSKKRDAENRCEKETENTENGVNTESKDCTLSD